MSRSPTRSIFGGKQTQTSIPLQRIQTSAAPSHDRKKPLFNINIEDFTKPLTDTESHSPSNIPHDTKPLHQASTWSTTKSHYQKPRRGSAWARRHNSPGVYWRKRWDPSHYPWINGRVLIIDCYSRDHSDDGKRKTESYEFNNEAELRDYYESGAGKGEGKHVLRIVHVQNAQWARDFLLRKFNINHRQDDLTGTAFGRWAVYDRPQKRAGKPVLNAKSFRTSRDPWRGVTRTGFGLDYLKHYQPHVIRADEDEKDWKMMELNHWNDNNNPAHGYDVYVQRLAVYVQRSEGPVNLSPDEDMKNPYLRENGRNGSVPDARDVHPRDWEKDALPLMESMDNGSTIIMFEASQSHAAEDTLIQARREIETRWRRLMHLLPREEIASEELLTVELMNIVLRDMFKCLQQSWEKTISKCDEHVSILEDKIYENPADESRATELWTNQAIWLKVEKLISLQVGVIGEIQNQMRELASGDDELKPHDEWFKHAPEEFKGVETMVQEQLVKPTANLSDLMYKSVGIRDARHSLQLGLSVWRLSWITFVFLPLTFMVGFFGMNVDTFQTDDFPSIKWYFIASVPLMCIVVIAYFVFKRADQDKRHNPVERGAYEHIYHDFAIAHPTKWSRYGPRVDSVRPRGWWSTLRWRLITKWFDPERTIAARPISDIDEMGLMAKIKRRLAMGWLDTIHVADSTGGHALDTAEMGLMDWTGNPVSPSRHSYTPFENLIAASMPVALADADPIIAQKLARRFMPRRSRSSSHGRGRGNRAGRRVGSLSPARRPGTSGDDHLDQGMIDEERSDDDYDAESSDESPGGSSSSATKAKSKPNVTFSTRQDSELQAPIDDFAKEKVPHTGRGPAGQSVQDPEERETETGAIEKAASDPAAPQVEKRGRSTSFRGARDFLGIPLKSSKSEGQVSKGT